MKRCLTFFLSLVILSHSQCKPVECCSQPPGKPAMLPSYNAPTRLPICGWDVYVKGTFLYWQAIEEGLELGTTSSPSAFKPSTVPSEITIEERIVPFHFTYKPAFQVAVGVKFDHDNWDGFLEYTWFHPRTGSKTWDHRDQLLTAQAEFSRDLTVFNRAKKRWNLKMDFIDATLSRKQYVGTELAFRPSFGIRAAWIRQREKTEYVGLAGIDTVINSKTHQYFNKSISWGLGPKIGLETNWLIYNPFRFIGETSLDLLYTRYNLLGKTHQFSTFHLDDRQNVSIELSENRLGCLRPHLELASGVGYDTYFGCNNWYFFDFSAIYSFQLFWHQNMFLKHINNALPQEDLFVHGLKLTVQADF